MPNYVIYWTWSQANTPVSPVSTLPLGSGWQGWPTAPSDWHQARPPRCSHPCQLSPHRQTCRCAGGRQLWCSICFPFFVLVPFFFVYPSIWSNLDFHCFLTSLSLSLPFSFVGIIPIFFPFSPLQIFPRLWFPQAYQNHPQTCSEIRRGALTLWFCFQDTQLALAYLLQCQLLLCLTFSHLWISYHLYSRACPSDNVRKFVWSKNAKASNFDMCIMFYIVLYPFIFFWRSASYNTRVVVFWFPEPMTVDSEIFYLLA